MLDPLYGSDALMGGAPMATPAGVTEPAGARPDPTDTTDKGPKHWTRDPIVWFTAAFALGSGIIGFRFHWGPGAKVSTSVDVADELSSILGQIFLAIAGIAAFKMIAARLAKYLDAPSLLDFADFI